MELRDQSARPEISAALEALFVWLEANDYAAYDTFDGLSARLLRPLTFEKKFLRQVLLQGVRRFPFNLRPLLGIPKSRSTKGMGFLARGFIRLHQSTGESRWAEKAHWALHWLKANASPGYSGMCWGNHFDYQSRGFYLPRGVPTVVWTSLIGQAFLDAAEYFQASEYLDVAVSACEHISRDLRRFPHGDAVCITYVPGLESQVHNANVLGAALLARTGALVGNADYLELARRACLYTARHQRPEGFWYYGESLKARWVDNFHTAYVLDCFLRYRLATGDGEFDRVLDLGYRYWQCVFFLADGAPRYYNHKTLPLDIQCASQAIDTLVFFAARDPEALPLALRVARWTLANMRDPSGYFYYRRYSRRWVNKTPTLHWGQATMFCALAGLLQALPSPLP